jgi:hypothetical protein
VDTRICEERVELDVITEEASYRWSNLVRDLSAAIVIMVRVVRLVEKGRWCPGLRSGVLGLAGEFTGGELRPAGAVAVMTGGSRGEGEGWPAC